MSEIASIKYVHPAKMRSIGRSIPKESATTIPPRNIEPVSPINTFAGFEFQHIKPTQAPATAADRTLNDINPSKPAAIINAQDTTSVTVDARPSIPSVRFTAFVNP